MTTPASSEARLARERAFHDERFADDARASVSRAYAVAAPATADYRRVARLAAGPGTHVLEYGCGVDGLAASLVGGGAQVTAIDISAVAIERSAASAAERGVEVTFAVMDAEALELADGSLDLVVGSGILHHLDLDRAVSEVARVLKPGGRAVFYEPLAHNPLLNLFRRLTPAMRTEDEHPLRMADVERIASQFRSAEVRTHVVLSLVLAPVAHTSWARRPLALLHRVDRALLRRIPALRRQAWIVVLELVR
ncbi:MAG: class I SAM-dependent methyltransferase [Ilumatobacteraceae bacterium]